MKNLKPIGIPRSIFLENLFAKTYDASKLEEDADRVRQAYHDRGYYTANVGDGRILTFEGSADWSILRDWRLHGGVVIARSRLVDPQPDFVTSQGRPLPASPLVTATSRIVWTHSYQDYGLRADLHGRYVGHSRLGVGPTLDIPYGDYAELGSTAAVILRHFEVSLGVENLLNSHANRFAIGNPFAVAFRNEATPLRPRTVRLGLSTGF